MKFIKVFVTVGTTQFNQLIETICTEEIAVILKDLGCRQLTIQYGTGDDNFDDSIFQHHGIVVEKYNLKGTILEDIIAADLIISHAGAGTTLEVLNHHKPLISVVNEELMNNHQVELAHKLAEENFLVYSTPRWLQDTLLNLDLNDIKPYPKGSTKKFLSELDKLMGFS